MNAIDDGISKPSNRIQFRGRRYGRKLRSRMRDLIYERLPKHEIYLDKTEGQVDPASFFETQMRAHWLEIGFGGGEHLAWQAKHNCDIGFIGCEPFVNGVASLLRHLDGDRPSNVRIFPDDARPLLDRLPVGCLERIFVLFPDPWPKRRHANRRIIQWETVETFYRILVPGGELRLATDDPRYQAWILTRMTAHVGFRWLARCARDWHARPLDWPQTRYEAKAISAGRRPAFLCFERL
ncbi:MAG: tRNA (guanosine(46)-N7)-methyltransferase TrmB [Rhodospirillaceae bacterium]|nr:tRNA (guanosine(46)-N7)-methyltransferase TrmB [Rhodospirillaceae bacterium]